MWDLKHDDRVIQAKILDEAWLNEFHGGIISINPGDSLRARVKTTTHYNEENEVVSMHHDIIEVLLVIHHDQSSQLQLPTGEDG